MNRKERRRHNAEMRKLPKSLTPVPEEEWPKSTEVNRIAVWRSRYFLVQLFEEPEEHHRLTVCRVTVGQGNRWNDDIAWDELQTIKHQIGLGDRWAAEVYPPDKHVVNVANMRHLWILPEEPVYGWKNAP